MEKPLLSFSGNCLLGHLIRREKRFFLAFEHKGEELWAHTNNSGGMLGLLRPGLPVLVSPAKSPGRKLPYTLELIGLGLSPANAWAGVNTLVPNRLLRAAFTAGLLPFAKGYTNFKAEVKYKNSRFDALLTGADLPPLWIECKNVTLVEDGIAAFPDAVTTRGQKHLAAMAELVAAGARAAFFYCIQRSDAFCFAPADYIDPVYAELFYDVLARGVEVYPVVTPADLSGIRLGHMLPLLPKARPEAL